MKLLLIITVITSALLSWHTVQSITVRTPCDPTGFQCINQTSFVVCVDIGNNILVPTPTIHNCVEDTVCVDGLNVPCTQITTTTSTTTTTASPSPAPTSNTTPAPVSFVCTRHGKFPGPICSQYYKCTKLVFWYVQTTHNCPYGLWFSALTQICVLPYLSGCS